MNCSSLLIRTRFLMRTACLRRMENALSINSRRSSSSSSSIITTTIIIIISLRTRCSYVFEELLFIAPSVSAIDLPPSSSLSSSSHFLLLPHRRLLLPLIFRYPISDLVLSCLQRIPVHSVEHARDRFPGPAHLRPAPRPACRPKRPENTQRERQKDTEIEAQRERIRTEQATKKNK